jgi:hypothetical protein
MSKYTVIISKNGRSYKICKIWYGSDGSYYVTVPYHPENKAVLFKQTANYDLATPSSINHEYITPIEEAIDVASSDDVRIKLSHHPDGFIQFSGHGLISGRNADGTPKGIGIQSWPLEYGCRGPAFGLTLQGIEYFQLATDTVSQSVCVLNYDELTMIPGCTGVAIEGHYFPLLWRRFIRNRLGGEKYIQIVHPSGAILELPVLLPSDSCPIGGFIGLDFYGSIYHESTIMSGYNISSSTGNVRTNEKGEKLGDGLYCSYPRPEDLPVRRSLDYQLSSIASNAINT